MYTHGIRVRKGCVISILRPTFDQEKTKFCKQQKIGGFEYFGDSDVMNKLIKVMKLHADGFFKTLEVILLSWSSGHLSFIQICVTSLQRFAETNIRTTQKLATLTLSHQKV